MNSDGGGSMKKAICAILAGTLLVLSGCQKKTDTADKLYSGCTFVLNSGDYYNVGVEVHYSDEYNFTWDKTMDHSMHELLDDLQTGDAKTIVPLVDDGKYYCSDIKRNDGKTWRTSFRIPKKNHDEMVRRLKNFSFNLNLTDKYDDVSYTSKVTLPVVDNSAEAKKE